MAAQQPRDTLRLCAVGDVNLDRRVAGAWLQGDTLYPFRALLESLRGADITFGNLESPIASAASPLPDSAGLFAAPPVAALALARAGFDIVSTANNHAWDGGQPAAEETMRQLTRAGVRFVGSGFGRDMAEQPVILERRQVRPALLPRWLTRRAGHVRAAGEPDELGHPVAGDVRRIQPFQHEHAWPAHIARLPGSVRYASEPVLEPRQQLLGFVPQLQGLPHSGDVLEDAVQRVGVQRHDPRNRDQRRHDAREVSLADRADLADGLPDQHIGTQVRHELDVHVHGRHAVAPRLRHRTIDRARWQRLIDATARHARQGAHLGRIVAFV